jgi:flagellar hook-basal body complex protein FliE
MLDSIRFPSPVELASAPTSAHSGAKTSGFAAALSSALDSVEKTRHDANTHIDQILRGEDVELHQVMLSVQKAEITFEMFQQVRNKVVQAYQELMRTQL